jgi:hypothetical protein
MNYDMRKPCAECPFLATNNFKIKRLMRFASGEFPCHMACETNEEGNYVAKNEKTPHCAGALIFNEKRNKPHQMARIAERFGMYDYTKLDMSVEVK